MRKKQEVERTVEILRHKGDYLSLIAAETLYGSMTEQQVFQKYVMNVAEADRDEDVFFAARDAARYLAGHIGLEDLIPDVELIPGEVIRTTLKPKPVKYDELITLPRKEFMALLRRVEKLERMVGINNNPQKVQPEIDMTDMMTLSEAAIYLRKRPSTINTLVKNCMLRVYHRDNCTYYSKSEIDRIINRKRKEE